MRSAAGLLLGFCVVSLSTSAPAQIIPPGLSVGDPYHLAFATVGVRDATSSDIADYDAFVQAQAETHAELTGGTAVVWRAIASTATVNARDHTAVGADVPVYLLDGTTKVVDGFSDLWDGSLDAAINRNQFAVLLDPATVWTGSNTSGNAFAGGLGGANPVTGATAGTGSGWITNVGRPSTHTYRRWPPRRAAGGSGAQAEIDPGFSAPAPPGHRSPRSRLPAAVRGSHRGRPASTPLRSGAPRPR